MARNRHVKLGWLTSFTFPRCTSFTYFWPGSFWIDTGLSGM